MTQQTDFAAAQADLDSKLAQLLQAYKDLNAKVVALQAQVATNDLTAATADMQTQATAIDAALGTTTVPPVVTVTPV